jgi:rubrerythrin
MLNKKLINNICDLIQADFNSIIAYKQAIKNIENDKIKQRLLTFLEDHDNHIKTLSKWVNDNGGKVPELKEDIKGYIIKGFTAIAAQIGLKSTLKALQQNEKITNKTYREALDLECDDAVLKANIKKGYDDEVRHLQYIDEQLNNETL